MLAGGKKSSIVTAIMSNPQLCEHIGTERDML